MVRGRRVIEIRPLGAIAGALLLAGAVAGCGVVGEGNAERDLGDYSSDLAVYGGWVWATAQVSEGTRLYRVDLRTARVVASEHGLDPSEGGYGELVAGGGYVWFGSGDGLARVAP